ncbi:MAG: YifB family Mg chelatase-like AAA ATPase [Candidatus Pacebacteria bacterium]|jgi:magnesium chelatase family protein|nr:YifB family Mg chelatase-like AAA ATPase [Candidatus Paceibacterota bacterium]
MEFSRVYTAQPSLLNGHIITIEVDISNGLHAFNVVGLPDKAVEESKDRVSSAIKNSGLKSPKSKNQKIVVSLSPAEIKKEGPYFDVGIALAYLLSSGDILFDPERKLFLGELALNGDIRPLRGVLPLVQEAKRAGFTEVYVPKQNAREAALVSDINIFAISTLSELLQYLDIQAKEKMPLTPEKKTNIVYTTRVPAIDFRDIKGQETAKRGLEIAAAGGHNIAMYGPPGTGKTMLARAFSFLLPDMTEEEIFEMTSIHSIAGTLSGDLITEVPFRAPHHTSSYVSIIGGGTIPKPGEVTLAHRGVLFLDEFPEFDKRVIESLRQPLEDKIVSISRAKGSAVFPSHFLLVAALNPCPCGNKTAKQKTCICRPNDLARYERKLSGPIVDRIDIWVPVGEIEYEKLAGVGTAESTDVIRLRVQAARESQRTRFAKANRAITKNSEMNAKDLALLSPLASTVETLLNRSAEKLKLSARAYHRVIKLARTIADLDASDAINDKHILEALQYRPK